MKRDWELFIAGHVQFQYGVEKILERALNK